MYLNIATTIALIASCLGEELLYDERSSNEAISTLRFNRDDVPISYKYSAVHQYTTQKSKRDDVIRPKKRDKPQYAAIQYAPLHTAEKGERNSTRYTKVVSESNNNAKAEKMKKLEPQEETPTVEGSPPVKYFVPGHNIELSRPPKQVPAYKDVHRSHSSFKGAYEEMNIPRQSMKNEFTKVEETIPNPIKLKRPLTPSGILYHDPLTWIYEENRRPNTYNTYTFRKGETGPTTINHIFPLPTHHTHRMRINVGRVNGRPQIIAREIVIGDALKKYEKLQSNQNIKGVIRQYPEIKTLLFPVRGPLLQNGS